VQAPRAGQERSQRCSSNMKQNSSVRSQVHGHDHHRYAPSKVVVMQRNHEREGLATQRRDSVPQMRDHAVLHSDGTSAVKMEDLSPEWLEVL
jgi:hypothetical protein